MAKIRTVLHSFVIGDVDDPEIYLAAPVYEWQQSECGRWCMEHAEDPRYRLVPDGITWGHRVIVYGELAEQDHTYFMLKWGTDVKTTA